MPAPAKETEVSLKSGDVRSQKKWGLNLEVTPLADYAVVAGSQISLNLNSSWQIGVAGLFGSKDFKDNINAPDSTSGQNNVVYVDKAKLSAFVADVYLRFFVGNSFAIKTGLGYRQALFNYRIAVSGTESFVEQTLTISSIAVPLFIGNHWSWKGGFSLGCDWIGAHFPISGQSEVTSSSNIEDTSGNLGKLQQDLLDLGSTLSQKVSLTLLVLTFGFQF